PPTCLEMGAFYPVLGAMELTAELGYTTYAKVAYPLLADNVSRPLPSRPRRLTQPVMSPPHGFSAPRPPLLAVSEHTEPLHTTILTRHPVLDHLRLGPRWHPVE